MRSFSTRNLTFDLVEGVSKSVAEKINLYQWLYPRSQLREYFSYIDFYWFASHYVLLDLYLCAGRNTLQYLKSSSFHKIVIDLLMEFLVEFRNSISCKLITKMFIFHYCYRQNTYSLSVVSIRCATGELRYVGILLTTLCQLYWCLLWLQHLVLMNWKTIWEQSF